MKKEAWSSFSHLIDHKYIKDNYRELSYLYEVLESLHSISSVDLSLGDLVSSFWAKYPDADRIIYSRFFDLLQSTPVSDEVAQETIRQIKLRKASISLSEAFFKVAQGLGSLEDAQSLYESSFKDQEIILGDLPLQHVTTDLTEIIDAVHQKQGLRWRLQCLNISLGSLRESDFGFIFARPETGKTTFLASEATRFLEQAQKPIVWLNNEEVGSKVMLRVYQAFFGVTLDKLISNPKRYKEEFLAKTGNYFHLFDSAQISRKDVEQIVARLNPCLVIYDQIDKIKGFTSDREDLRLGNIYQWARELAKGSHAAIGVCQADGHAEGVRYLTMEHVANAKTAKQAEADWILGIGRTNSDDGEYVRYFNISKNKLVGDADSIAEFRHGKFETIIEPTIARYKDVIDYK